jgi:hypothetical protein
MRGGRQERNTMAPAIGRVFRDMAVDKSRFSDEDLQIYRQAAAAPEALRTWLQYQPMPLAPRVN